MIVRAAHPADARAIRAVVDAAFGGPAEGALVEALRESGDAALELVAKADGKILGHVMLSRLASPQNCLALAPLAVAPGFQRRGVGGALIKRAVEEAREAGASAIFLLGEPAYYARFGFSVAAAATFETVYPKDYMMALELSPGALAATGGAIDYAAPFSAL